nr:soluble beta-fructofuranosidase polypeptide a isoenzyme I, S-beta F=invertase [Daucus carota L.=carrots, cv. Nantaise, Peptide Partial, 6 aa] [Daucus carota]AAB21661.1 soluble beta-fructofuranosidase polypeptide b isoenzyme I, S-beta F=invertase [Daucus carota L.=carrots, cv. Nantaise, Peptide Partial, 6 aa] [Daucus carota]
AEPSYP